MVVRTFRPRKLERSFRLSIDADSYERFAQVARHMNTSMAEIGRAALAEWLARYERRMKDKAS